MSAPVVELLACPNCRAPFETEGFEAGEGALLCARGHSFDIARQGYVSLVSGPPIKVTGDTADMLEHRARFLAAGYFDPIADAVAAHVHPGARVLEIGAGTGFYLHRAVDAAAGSIGIGMDVAKPAARRIARLGPAIGAIVADAWRPFPIRDAVLTHVLSIFAPRNAAEIARVLQPDGVYVVVTPTSRHLRQLVEPLGMVGVDDAKPRRLGDALSGRFERISSESVDFTMELPAADIEAVAAMGPSAFHRTPAQRADAIAALPDPMIVTASVTVACYRVVVAAAAS